jgi:phosphate transport system permease protein
MTFTFEEGDETERAAERREQLVHRGRGERGDTAFRGLTVAAGVTVLAVLGLILVSTSNESVDAFREAGLDFFTSDRWAPNEDAYGALAFIYGTVVVSAISLVLAVPVSIGIALFTVELVPRKLRGLVTTAVDLLATIPSVVYGLWGVLVLAPAVVGFYDNLANWSSPVPGLRVLFGEGGTGRSFMTAGLVLAVMITPIITSITREVFNMVPRAEKDAALALGATRWEMIRGAVLPYSFGGMVGAVMLGLGRAMGETIAIALTIGSSIQIVGNLTKSGSAMPEVIVQQWGESSGTHRSALIAIGVLLFVMTIGVNMLARLVVNRAERTLRGA